MDVTGRSVQILQPPGVPVPVSGSFAFSSGTVTVDNTSARPVPVSGSFSLSSGSVTVTNPSTAPVYVDVTNASLATVPSNTASTALWVTLGAPATVTATAADPVAVTGSVTADLAAGSTVGLGAGTAAVGSVSVSNFPATQAVTGTVTADLAADATPGSAAPAVALFVAGTDGTDARGLATTAYGQLIVAGQDPAGTGLALPVAGAGNPAPANGLAVGGTDGTDLRLLATDTAGRLQLASVSDPVTVTTGPHQIANIAAGTAIAAAGTILTATYTAPADGTLNVTYALETATPVQVSYDGGTYYADLAAGSAAVANALYAYSQGIPSGAVVQFSVPTATTIGIFAAWFQATQ